MKKQLLLVIALFMTLSASSQVLINIEQGNPDPNAMLEVRSGDQANPKGILLPKLNATQEVNIKLKTPTEGLVYYSETSKQIMLNNGTNFIPVGTPIGGIMMWSGDPSALPIGWALCDGAISNGFTTPDLSGRFIVGYDAAASASPTNITTEIASNYGQVNNTGGDNFIQLKPEDIPQHQHEAKGNGADMNITASGNHRHNLSTSVDNIPGTRSHVQSSSGVTSPLSTPDPIKLSEHTHNNSDFTGSTGLGVGLPVTTASRSNRPAYYVLAFIIRTE